MSSKAVKELGKTHFCGLNYVRNLKTIIDDLHEQSIENRKGKKKVLPENGAFGKNRGKLLRTEIQKPYVNKTLFYNKGLLPTADGLFWIHKRWKGECAATCPKKLGLAPEEGKLDPAIPQPKVVIVGAGMAGLSAAWRLAQAGFNNFHVFEATDRIGGRIHSCWVGDVVTELGPQWLREATVSNPLYSLAAQERLLEPPIAWRKACDEGVFLSSEGRALEPGVVRPARSFFRRVRELAVALVGKERGSLGNFMRARFGELIKSVPEDFRSDTDKVFWALANQDKTKYGVGGDKLSSEVLGSTISLPGGSLRIPLGMLGLLGPLMRKIDSKCISTCRAVDSICWQRGEPRGNTRQYCIDIKPRPYDMDEKNLLIQKICTSHFMDNMKVDMFLAGKHRVRVLLSDNKEPVLADYVLITVPLGVLKEKTGMFNPCLPEEKMAAINRLGWTTINRFILSYERPFWLPGDGCYRFAWSQEQRENKESWVKGLSVLEEIPGAPNLLSFSLGDEEAKMAESCKDEDVVEQVVNALREFSGDMSLPYPKGFVRSRWGTEPHFLGSTSYMSLESTVADYCELSRPFPEDRPILLFAGEATAPGHAASLLGAHLSGVREGDRLLKLTIQHSKSCNRP